MLCSGICLGMGILAFRFMGQNNQTDRELTISDFESNVCSLLIATGVAARGLGVKKLELGINFDPPNHYEDYAHRVVRTGRAS